MPCLRGELFYIKWVPVGNPPGEHPNDLTPGGFITSVPIRVPCPPGSAPGSGETDEQLGLQALQNVYGFGLPNPSSPAGSGTSLPDWLLARQKIEEAQDVFTYAEPRPPTLAYDPNNPYNNPRPSNKPIKQNLKAGPIDPCSDAQQTLQNSQIPQATGDSYTEYENTTSTNSKYSYQQLEGLGIERLMADYAKDAEQGSGLDWESSFEDAIKTLQPTDRTPQQIVDKVLASILGVDPSQIGTLSDAFTQTIDQLIQEIEDGNGGNIHWSAFGDYLNAQADADAAAMQAKNLDPNGTGSSPCGDINKVLQGAMSRSRNGQLRANRALGRLDRNIKVPTVPKGGHYITGGDFPPTKYVGPSVGPIGTATGVKATPVRRPSGSPRHIRVAPSGAVATAAATNLAQAHPTPISPGLLHRSALAPSGPAVPVSTWTPRPKLTGPVKGSGSGPIFTLPTPQFGQEDLSIGMVGTLTDDINNYLKQYDDILREINIQDFNDPEQAWSDYANLCDATLQELMPLYHYLEDILNKSDDYSARAAAEAELKRLVAWLNYLSDNYTEYDAQHRKSRWWP